MSPLINSLKRNVTDNISITYAMEVSVLTGLTDNQIKNPLRTNLTWRGLFFKGKLLRISVFHSDIFHCAEKLISEYGMNFDFMPELWWKLGYAGVLLLMAIVIMSILYGSKGKNGYSPSPKSGIFTSLISFYLSCLKPLSWNIFFQCCCSAWQAV